MEAAMTEDTGKTTTMDVVVHKASIPLMAGESVFKFTQTLSEKAREHCFAKLNMDTKKDGAWMAEAFGNAVVMSTYKGAESTKYYAFTYKRDAKTGSFDFGNLTEVERVVGFKPKTADITKAADSAEAPMAEGWKPIVKDDIWSGIL